MDDLLQQRVADLLDKRPVAWRPATGGYTAAQRWIVTLEDGSSCFLKAGSTALTSDWLRDEYTKVYSRLQAPFLPRLLGWHDDRDQPLLVLEDLSVGYWPPPWTPDSSVDAVLATLSQLRPTKLADLPPVRAIDAGISAYWLKVQADPEPLLSLGLMTRDWLHQALPALISAAGQADLHGEDLLHLDVRSDNLCLMQDRGLLVDWNWACRGNGELDIAFWLPSLHSEGGPTPEQLLPDAPHWAAVVSGYFASHAGLAGIPDAPRVREVQLSQLRSALPWAVRALGLPPLDGPNIP